MSRLVINEKEELVKLDNVRIRDREMIPEYTTTTNRITETMEDPEGNVVGIKSSIVRTSTVVLRPEEYYKIEKKRRKNAEENGSEIKETSKKKGFNR